MKPFTLKVQEIEDKLVEIINKSELPAYVLKVMLNNLLIQIDNIDKEEIANYEKTQNNGIMEVENNTKEKESDK